MKAIRLLLAAATLLIASPLLHAQDTLAALQGRWVVTAGEHDGKPMDAIKNGVMTITGNAFEVRTASGNMLKGTLTVDTTKTPFQMDMTHADGEKWEAVYSLEGGAFKINYVEKGGKDPRPTGFKTSDKTEESLVVMEREKR